MLRATASGVPTYARARRVQRVASMPKITHPRGRLAEAVRRAQTAEISAALALYGGAVPATAEYLGVSRRSLYTLIDRLGLRTAAGLPCPSAHSATQ